MKSESANPTIGLLICKDKDQTEVQWAFQGIKTPMGVATYDNIRLQEIKSQLPSEEAIQKRLEQAEEYILKLKEKNIIQLELSHNPFGLTRVVRKQDGIIL